MFIDVVSVRTDLPLGFNGNLNIKINDNSILTIIINGRYFSLPQN